jgi:hypothetical protein
VTALTRVIDDPPCAVNDLLRGNLRSVQEKGKLRRNGIRRRLGPARPTRGLIPRRLEYVRDGTP